MSITHGMFCLERTYDASPARVFAAFSNEEGKDKWFSGENELWDLTEHAFDFRVGGREITEGKWKDGGRISRCEITYFDIKQDERIIYAYEMIIDGVKISTSLASVETRPEGSGTKLVITEQGAFLDGYDDAGSREEGTAWLLERLRASLA